MLRRLLAAVLAAFLIAQPAAAQLLTLGVGPGSAGSGASAYDPGGVLFWNEGGAKLTSAGNFNGGTDTSHGIIAFRRMAWLGTPATQTNGFRSSAAFGSYGSGTCTAEGCQGFMINADAASWVTPGTGFTLRNTYAPSTATEGTSPNPRTGVQGLGYAFDFTWQSVVVFYDTNQAANSRIVRVFVDGSLLSTTNDDAGTAFTVNWNNARGICISDCNRSSGIQTGGALMLADVIVDTANALPAGCPGTAANCQAVVDAFYKSGKPVNPGTGASDCTNFRASYSASVKTDWCLRGNKATFLANTDGLGNTMAVTTDVASTTRTTGNGQAAIYNAPYGQAAEPTDRPYRAWAAPISTNAVTTTSTTSCTAAKCDSNVMGNFGGKILTGDRLFIAWQMCYTSAVPSSTLPTLSAGWSFVASSTTPNPSLDVGANARCTWLVATHVATNNYIGVNTDWVVGNAFVDPPTITYDCTPHGACATAPLQVGFVMFDYRSTNATVNIDASDFTSINMTANSALTLTTPSITTTKATETLVSLCMSKSTARPTNPPAGEELAVAQPFSASGVPIITIGDEKLTSAGATGTRTYLQSGTASTNERAYCGLIALANS